MPACCMVWDYELYSSACDLVVTWPHWILSIDNSFDHALVTIPHVWVITKTHYLIYYMYANKTLLNK